MGHYPFFAIRKFPIRDFPYARYYTTYTVGMLVDKLLDAGMDALDDVVVDGRRMLAVGEVGHGGDVTRYPRD